MTTTLTPDTAELRKLNRSAAIKWTCFIVGLLLLNVLLCTAGVIAAIRTNPPVVKDYYNKAVNWDTRHTPTNNTPNN